MVDYSLLEKSIESIIDSLKGICNQNGLGNASGEERVITTVFLYKFLNDKFMYYLNKFSKTNGYTEEQIFANKSNELDAFYDSIDGNVVFGPKDTIEYLIQFASTKDFYKLFDEALNRISNYERNTSFNIETSDGTRRPLFEPISKEVEESNKDNFIKSIFGAISSEKFDFSSAFSGSFDFYARIFEYLIKDYNGESGKYAEYFTPQTVSRIIAKILVGMSEKIVASEIYDPSAGSGSLILHLANELGKDQNISRAIVYTQDISQKSSRFLRINLLLNGLTDSLHNVIQGDTLLNPAHFNVEGDPHSGLKTFDYVVANPPFKLDFSSNRNAIENKWGEFKNSDGLKRFFAGIPNIPKKKKDSMPIYLLFIQHIIFSMKPNGKAAIVVPTGFITAKSGIEAKIRDFIVKKRMLKGCISMPSNIFATTGTNVSVIFLDKKNDDGKAILMDASSMGEKLKEGKNQRTYLSDAEVNKIIDTFINRKEIDDFSKLVSFKEIADKNNSFSVGQYFDVKIEKINITEEEFKNKMAVFKKELEESFKKTNELDEKILTDLNNLKFTK